MSLTMADLDDLVLAHGGHSRREEGVCLMEAVAWFAGKSHSDRPPCVSPVLGSFARSLNDQMDNEDRQQLKRFIPLLPGTAGNPEADRARGWMAMDWLIHVRLVAWLEVAGLTDHVTALQELAPVLNDEALEAARPVVRRARAAAGDAYSASWSKLRKTYGPTDAPGKT